MKRALYGLAAFICCMLWVLPARADVLIEPMDSFYEEHSEECSYMGRSFTTNGPDGKVIVYKSPKLPEVVDTWENGREVYIRFTYEDRDGVVWGIYEDYVGITGWMPMDYMELIYDSISFQEDYSEEIEDEMGSLDEKYLDEEIRFWKYPGSEKYDSIKAESYAPEYRCVYVDENGKSWGRIGYYFGMRDVWVCIDAPTADYGEIYPDGAPQIGKQDGEKPQGGAEPEETPAGEDRRIVPKPDYGMVALTIILVLLVAAVTAALLLFLRKKGNRG